MNSKVAAAQEHINGLTVAHMITDFQIEFRHVYPYHLMVSPMMAVGPMQSFLGNAIAKGILKLENDHDWQEVQAQKKSGSILRRCLRSIGTRLASL